MSDVITEIFRGLGFWQNDKVTKSQYHELKAGSEIPCIFEKQWRADGSETYLIWVVK